MFVISMMEVKSLLPFVDDFIKQGIEETVQTNDNWIILDILGHVCNSFSIRLFIVIITFTVYCGSSIRLRIECDASSLTLAVH